jgi:protein-S-isoprenylcysteine O-methyltransferase
MSFSKAYNMTAAQPDTSTKQETPLLPKVSQYSLRGSLPNSPLSVSIISALLGGLLFSSLALAASPVLEWLGASQSSWARSQLGIYLSAMALFHLCEFWTTAGWNAQKLTVDGE